MPRLAIALILALALGGCVALPAAPPAPAPLSPVDSASARPQFYEFYSPL